VKRIVLSGIFVAVAANIAVLPGEPQPDAAKVEFDAVSIRPSSPDARGGGFNVSPGRLNAKNVSLEELVNFAYGLHGYQLSGGSGWMETEHYEMVATFPAATTNSQRARMMQAMLADRFRLAIHRESKEIPGYALVTGKNGPRLHAAESAESGMMLGRSATTGQRTLHGTSAKMQDLASILADLLGRPVTDATGLTGIYDFSMEWTPDPVSEGSLRKGGDRPEVSPDGQTGPSIFTALQEALGLKLETRKVAVETIVIDQAEKPSAN
jgi:uncharacterized protein (TIGR03435 family)